MMELDDGGDESYGSVGKALSDPALETAICAVDGWGSVLTCVDIIQSVTQDAKVSTARRLVSPLKTALESHFRVDVDAYDLLQDGQEVVVVVLNSFVDGASLPVMMTHQALKNRLFASGLVVTKSRVIGQEPCYRLIVNVPLNDRCLASIRKAITAFLRPFRDTLEKIRDGMLNLCRQWDDDLFKVSTALGESPVSSVSCRSNTAHNPRWVKEHAAPIHAATISAITKSCGSHPLPRSQVAEEVIQELISEFAVVVNTISDTVKVDGMIVDNIKHYAAIVGSKKVGTKDTDDQRELDTIAKSVFGNGGSDLSVRAASVRLGITRDELTKGQKLVKDRVPNQGEANVPRVSAPTERKERVDSTAVCGQLVVIQYFHENCRPDTWLPRILIRKPGTLDSEFHIRCVLRESMESFFERFLQSIDYADFRRNNCYVNSGGEVVYPTIAKTLFYAYRCPCVIEEGWKDAANYEKIQHENKVEAMRNIWKTTLNDTLKEVCTCDEHCYYRSLEVEDQKLYDTRFDCLDNWMAFNACPKIRMEAMDIKSQSLLLTKAEALRDIEIKKSSSAVPLSRTDRMNSSVVRASVPIYKTEVNHFRKKCMKQECDHCGIQKNSDILCDSELRCPLVYNNEVNVEVLVYESMQRGKTKEGKKDTFSPVPMIKTFSPCAVADSLIEDSQTLHLQLFAGPYEADHRKQASHLIEVGTIYTQKDFSTSYNHKPQNAPNSFIPAHSNIEVHKIFYNRRVITLANGTTKEICDVVAFQFWAPVGLSFKNNYQFTAAATAYTYEWMRKLLWRKHHVRLVKVVETSDGKADQYKSRITLMIAAQQLGQQHLDSLVIMKAATATYKNGIDHEGSVCKMVLEKAEKRLTGRYENTWDAVKYLNDNPPPVVPAGDPTQDYGSVNERVIRMFADPQDITKEQKDSGWVIEVDMEDFKMVAEQINPVSGIRSKYSFIFVAPKKGEAGHQPRLTDDKYEAVVTREYGDIPKLITGPNQGKVKTVINPPLIMRENSCVGCDKCLQGLYRECLNANTYPIKEIAMHFRNVKKKSSADGGVDSQQQLDDDDDNGDNDIRPYTPPINNESDPKTKIYKQYPLEAPKLTITTPWNTVDIATVPFRSCPTSIPADLKLMKGKIIAVYFDTDIDSGWVEGQILDAKKPHAATIDRNNVQVLFHDGSKSNIEATSLNYGTVWLLPSYTATDSSNATHSSTAVKLEPNMQLPTSSASMAAPHLNPEAVVVAGGSNKRKRLNESSNSEAALDN